ncbi:hypothetical protein GKODMF_04695 [Candidatus Electrothrix gigas]
MPEVDREGILRGTYFVGTGAVSSAPNSDHREHALCSISGRASQVAVYIDISDDGYKDMTSAFAFVNPPHRKRHGGNPLVSSERLMAPGIGRNRMMSGPTGYGSNCPVGEPLCSRPYSKRMIRSLIRLMNFSVIFGTRRKRAACSPLLRIIRLCCRCLGS